MFPAGNQAEHLSLYLDGSNQDRAGPGAAQGWMRAAKFSLSVVNQSHLAKLHLPEVMMATHVLLEKDSIVGDGLLVHWSMEPRNLTRFMLVLVNVI